jgi:hypothetical protein
VIAFVGVVQLPVPPAALAAVTVVAVVDRVRAPFVNVVDVPVRFQPARLPDSSSTVSARLVVGVWSVPFNVTDQDAVVGAVRESEPPAHASNRRMLPPTVTAHPSEAVGNEAHVM